MKHGLLAEGEQLVKKPQSRFQKQLSKEKNDAEDKERVDKAKHAAWVRYNNLGTTYHE